MRYMVFALMLLGTAATAARAQDAIPDLKGTWSGKGMAIVFGNNPHHPGSQTATDQPRVHEIEAKYVVEGQDGRLAWGRSSSTVADTKEPFAWAIASDNKTIVGADMDAIFVSRSSRLTALKSVTPITVQARVNRSSPRVS
jgi:hypothetical protein